MSLIQPTQRAFFSIMTTRQEILALIVVSAMVGSGCTKGSLLHKSFVECNNTDTCQTQIRERDYAFAKAVADEPISKRLNVETVTRVVLVDLQKQRVYALDPHFVTLNLASGQELVRFDKAAGDSLFRVGGWLVSTPDEAKTVSLAFVDPTKPTQSPIVCSPKVPMPVEAEEVTVHPFDRAGQVYFYWHSGFSYRGGTPPSAEIEKQEEMAEGCGIMRIDVATCSVQSVPLEDFVWEPPEGRRQRPGEKDFCDYLSPLRDIPAAAASAAPVMAGYGQLAPATRAPALSVKSEKGEQKSCREETKLTLEARDESANVKWSHPLAPIVNYCKPP